jgi:hypothetical protein
MISPSVHISLCGITIYYTETFRLFPENGGDIEKISAESLRRRNLADIILNQHDIQKTSGYHPRAGY